MQSSLTTGPTSIPSETVIQIYDTLPKTAPTLNCPSSSRAEYAEDYYNKAVGELRRQEYRDAISYCDRALQYEPYRAEIHCLRGIAYLRLSEQLDAVVASLLPEYEAAKDEVGEYSWVYPRRYVEAEYRLTLTRKGFKASCFDRNKAVNNAKYDFDKALSIDADYAEAYYNRGLLKQCSYYDGGGVDYDFYHHDRVESWTYHRGSGGNTGEAIEDFTEAIRLGYERSQVYKRRGLAFMDLNMYTAAVADFVEAERLDPHDAETYKVHADTNIRCGRYLDAVAICDAAVELVPDDGELYEVRGRAKALLERHTDAIEDYDIALQLSSNLEWMFERDRLRPLAVIEGYDEQIQREPDNAVAHYELGHMRLEVGDDAGAVTAFSEVICLDPGNDQAFKYRGVAKFNLKQYDAAINDFAAAVERNPNDVETYRKRLKVHRQLEKYDSAIEDYDNIVRLEPDNHTAYFNRGLLKLEWVLSDERADCPKSRKRYRDAISDFDKTLHFNPGHAFALCRRAEAQWRVAFCDFAEAMESNNRVDLHVFDELKEAWRQYISDRAEMYICTSFDETPRGKAIQDMESITKLMETRAI